MVSVKSPIAPSYNDEDSPYTGLHVSVMPKAGSPYPVRPFKWSIADRYALSVKDILKWRTAWCTYRKDMNIHDKEECVIDEQYVDRYVDFREQKLREPFPPQHFQMAYTDSSVTLELLNRTPRPDKTYQEGVSRVAGEPYTNSTWASRVLKQGLHTNDNEGRDKMVQEAFALAGFDMHTKGQGSV